MQYKRQSHNVRSVFPCEKPVSQKRDAYRMISSICLVQIHQKRISFFDLHFFKEGWEASDGHEGHETSNKSAAGSTCQDRGETRADVEEYGADAER